MLGRCIFCALGPSTLRCPELLFPVCPTAEFDHWAVATTFLSTNPLVVLIKTNSSLVLQTLLADGDQLGPSMFLPKLIVIQMDLARSRPAPTILQENTDSLRWT